MLLAVWTVRQPGSPSYEEQVAALVSEWEEEIRDGQTIIAGDFNCAAQAANPRKHMANIAHLRELGAASAYHHYNQVEHGAEEEMTLRWIAKGRRVSGFHCDFIFVSRSITPCIAHVNVGSFQDWIENGLSDHCPVRAEFGTAQFG